MYISRRLAVLPYPKNLKRTPTLSMQDSRAGIAVRTIQVIIGWMLKQIYLSILLRIPTLYRSRVGQLIGSAVSFRSSMQERLNRLCSPRESVIIASLMREQWEELLPSDIPHSMQTEAAQKFSRLWKELIDTVMNDCNISLTVSGGIIA
jgi:hypothetical protein